MSSKKKKLRFHRVKKERGDKGHLIIYYCIGLPPTQGVMHASDVQLVRN